MTYTFQSHSFLLSSHQSFLFPFLLQKTTLADKVACMLSPLCFLFPRRSSGEPAVHTISADLSRVPSQSTHFPQSLFLSFLPFTFLLGRQSHLAATILLSMGVKTDNALSSGNRNSFRSTSSRLVYDGYYGVGHNQTQSDRLFWYAAASEARVKDDRTSAAAHNLRSRRQGPGGGLGSFARTPISLRSSRCFSITTFQFASAPTSVNITEAFEVSNFV